MASGLFHRQWGDGEPLIAIHGLFGSIENLGMITRQLKDSYRVYALDLPNHGRSTHVDHINLAFMAEKVIQWMDENQLESAHFLGHSLGGKLSMEIALRYPEKVNHLIVADISPVQYPRRHDDVFAAIRAVPLDQINSRKDADEAMRPHVNELSTRSFLLKNLHQVDGQWLWRVNIDGLERDYEQLIAGNSTSYPPFEKPVLFVKGEHSSYILPEHKDSILSLFPLASVKVINNTEHWLHAEKPEIFAGIVLRFLQT